MTTEVPSTVVTSSTVPPECVDELNGGCSAVQPYGCYDDNTKRICCATCSAYANVGVQPLQSTYELINSDWLSMFLNWFLIGLFRGQMIVFMVIRMNCVLLIQTAL